MAPPPLVQRNPYKGSPTRAWVRLRLIAKSGVEKEVELLADTGSPFALIISVAMMQQFAFKPAADMQVVGGQLLGGWFHVRIPDVNLDQSVEGYANDDIVATVQTSSPDFKGLLGLPLLRMMEYGGDHYWFWIRPAAGVP